VEVVKNNKHPLLFLVVMS